MGSYFCRARLGRRTARLHRASGRLRVHRQDPALCLPRALRRLADLRSWFSGGLAAWRRGLATEREGLRNPRWVCAGSLPALTEQAWGSPSIGTCEDREVGLGSSLAMTLGKEPR